MFLAGNMLVEGVQAANLGDTKTVYILPMTNGLDQYLAVRLTTGLVMQVVADPNKADAILTDQLGPSFEQRLDDLYGNKPKEKTDDANSNAGTFSRVQGGSHSRGTVFLVDRKSRDVLWSVYERPKDTSPDGMRRAADRIAGKLASSVKQIGAK